MNESKKKFLEGMWQVNTMADSKIKEISSILDCHESILSEKAEEKSIQFDENWVTEKRKKKNSIKLEDILGGKEKVKTDLGHSEVKSSEITQQNTTTDPQVSPENIFAEESDKILRFLHEYKAKMKANLLKKKKAKSLIVSQVSPYPGILAPISETPEKFSSLSKVQNGFKKKFNRILIGSERSRSNFYP